MAQSINVLERLASTLGRRDETPNLELAIEISQNSNRSGVRVLVENLLHKSKAIQNDCIKVLYEIGAREPKLITPYLENFLRLLQHKNNRLQWGAMTALHEIAKVKPKEIYANLPLVLESADKGSVITRDQAVNILITLASIPKFSKATFTLLIEQLLKSPTNQLPMYAERMFGIINDRNKNEFIKALTQRLPDIEKESKRKRVEKVIKKVMTA